jgi:hypothetical protein
MVDIVISAPGWGVVQAIQSVGGRIAFAQSGSSPSASIAPGQSDSEAFLANFSSMFTVDPTELQFGAPEIPFGHYFKRIARPLVGKTTGETIYPGSILVENEMASLRGQLVTLMQMAERICGMVHHCQATMSTYGHDIRNLLILACTEVEAHWRSVLAANGETKSRLKTTDYVKLTEPMRLAEYEVVLQHFPWLTPFKPFENWRVGGRSTADLQWYADYNAVKHDREGRFAQATLGNALNAICACAIMLHAQFGTIEAFRWRLEFGYFFRFVARPTWDARQYYAYYSGQPVDQGWTPLEFNFGP